MSPTGPELELLVLRAQAGDRAAFETLVGRWHPSLRRQAARYLVDGDLLRDAVQDAWCAIVRGLRRLEDPARFPPWSLRIAQACAVDVLRRRGRIDRSERAAVAAAADSAAGSAAQSAGPAIGATDDRDERIRRAVAMLDHDHRVVVELFYLEGLSAIEVAAALGLAHGTVKSRLFHARERLRAALATAPDDSDRKTTTVDDRSKR